MRTPRKLYVVVSRKAPHPFNETDDVFLTRREAEAVARNRNQDEEAIWKLTQADEVVIAGVVDDYRVETFVKGGER